MRRAAHMAAFLAVTAALYGLALIQPVSSAPAKPARRDCAPSAPQAAALPTPDPTQGAQAPSKRPDEDLLDAIVLIRVGDRVTGTGVGMDDGAASIVTSARAIHGYDYAGERLTVEYRHDGFRRGAIVVASEKNYGLVVLWPAGGAPRSSASTGIVPPETGDEILLLGEMSSPGIPSGHALAYGRMTVRESADTVVRRRGTAPQGFVVAEPREPLGGPGSPTPGMAVFDEKAGRLVGIVRDWNGDSLHPSFTIIPAPVIDAALRVVEESRKPPP